MAQIRRSISIPQEAAKRIKQIKEARPHMTENAIIVDAIIVGLGVTYGHGTRRGVKRGMKRPD